MSKLNIPLLIDVIIIWVANIAITLVKIYNNNRYVTIIIELP